MDNVTIIPTEQPTSVTGEKFISRAGAYIIDMIFNYLITYPVNYLLSFILAFIATLVKIQYPSISSERSLADYGFALLLTFFYFTLFEWLCGATVGKYIMGMRVIMDDGQPCTLLAAFIRALLRFVDLLFFAIPAMLSMQAPLYKRIGDNAVHTIVVSSNSAFIKQPRSWRWFLLGILIFLPVRAIFTLLTVYSYAH